MRQNLRSTFIDDIEILGVFAILLVVFQQAKKVASFLAIPYNKEFYSYFGGKRGGDLFYLISGFVITRSMLSKLQHVGH